ncbi:MAG: hypothetical protein WD357_09500 [Gracilimonas sp.]
MSGYSEIFYVMFAMVIFSVILANSNRLINRNSTIQIQGELEQEVIAIAQEIIEESQTKKFDEVNVGNELPPAGIPSDFTGYGSLGPDATETSRRYYDDFDDYDGHTETATTVHGDFDISAEVFYVDGTNYEFMSGKSTFKKIVVTIESEFLRNNAGEINSYSLEFIRNYYAD